MTQREHSSANERAWSHRAYEAMVRLGGTPEEAAEKLRSDPEHTLRHYRKHLGDVNGKKIANLLGSGGKKAIALALLGARVTVVDITEENRRYALASARAAGVSLDYIISDILEWDTKPHHDHFDMVLMELGILHYFVDLNPLTKLIYDILAPEGRLILHEAHPFLRKCAPKYEGDRLILEGNYFSEEVVRGPAPRHVAFSEEEVASFPDARYRYWRLGEVVTAIIEPGLTVETLIESPHGEFPQLPGTFTLVAKK